MSSSGLIYAVIVGAWAAYLVPMWLRRQDELNEARPTERFSTAIRLLSGRAGMERRYAKDLMARSADEDEPPTVDPGVPTDSVDVRSFAVRAGRPVTTREVPPEPRDVPESREGRDAPREPAASGAAGARGVHAPGEHAPRGEHTRGESALAHGEPVGRRLGGQSQAERARRSQVLARRRRTTVVLFLAFTLGAVVAAVGGLALLWAPAVPAVLLSAYIVYLRAQERHRFTYTMDRRRAEAAAERLRERERQPRRRAHPRQQTADDSPEGHGRPVSDPVHDSLVADRRALVEQTDHAEWEDQQRERRRGPAAQGDSWDPVPVPLPTYVTAPVAPRAAERPARPGERLPAQNTGPDGGAPRAEAGDAGEDPAPGGALFSGDAAEPEGAVDVRRAASARRSRERGRTPLFDQYAEGGRPRAANE